MNRFSFKFCTAMLLGFTLTPLFAMPKAFTTHNKTKEESNAYVAGVPSPRPSAPQKDTSVNWAVVMIACGGHTVNSECKAVVKMKTNTQDPIEIGEVTMNLHTGEIWPQQLSANGYVFTVNAPGEVTLSYAQNSFVTQHSKSP